MQNVYISQPNGYKVDFDNMLKLMQGWKNRDQNMEC
jgi:hypothetical protein